MTHPTTRLSPKRGRRAADDDDVLDAEEDYDPEKEGGFIVGDDVVD